MAQKKAPWFIQKHGSAPLKKRRKRVNPISAKRRVAVMEYGRLRKKFLFVNFTCQVEGCRMPATQVHHRRGRRGDNYLNIFTWLATCIKCHDLIHRNPKWAMKHGYLESFLK